MAEAHIERRLDCRSAFHSRQSLKFQPKKAKTEWRREGALRAAPGDTLQLCFSSGRGLVSSVGGSTSARWALRNAVFSSLFRFFSSLRARAALARSARSRP